jgi:serine/threonine protein kinase
MHYCHIRGIVHRDLKLENVLFKQTGDLTIKVVDFGIAGVCDATKKDKVDAGSIAYMPPESFKSNSETSPAIDVWAIGVMQYAMLFGRLPFWGDTEEETINKIQNAPLKFDPEVCITDECKEFMTNMLQKQADKRMDLINLIQLPYFIMDDEELE